MTELIYFTIGVAFIILAVPIMQSITEVICTFCEVLKAQMSISISKSSVKIQDMSDSLQPCNTNVIGFKASETIEEDYDDEEDKLTNRKVGF